MERIIASAYKVKPEFAYDKNRCTYKTGIKEADDIYNCRIGRHHAEILHLWGDEVDHDTDGFYTSYGRWVDREEAARIAIAAGQIKECHYFGGKKLDSSDLFDLDYEGNLI